MREISQRQESDQHGVQEAHMMQAMEFNSAWSQNMTEFERQAREIEEACSAKQQKEYEEFQEKLRQKMGRGYKFSRDLLLMRKSIDTLANQGRYDEAHVLKSKADQLERWERMKLDNEHKTLVATKELQLRQSQAAQLDAPGGAAVPAAQSCGWTVPSTGQLAPATQIVGSKEPRGQ